jgi:hypothetical protein
MRALRDPERKSTQPGAVLRQDVPALRTGSVRAPVPPLYGCPFLGERFRLLEHRLCRLLLLVWG